MTAACNSGAVPTAGELWRKCIVLFCVLLPLDWPIAGMCSSTATRCICTVALLLVTATEAMRAPQSVRRLQQLLSYTSRDLNSTNGDDNRYRYTRPTAPPLKLNSIFFSASQTTSMYINPQLTSQALRGLLQTTTMASDETRLQIYKDLKPDTRTTVLEPGAGNEADSNAALLSTAAAMSISMATAAFRAAASAMAAAEHAAKLLHSVQQHRQRQQQQQQQLVDKEQLMVLAYPPSTDDIHSAMSRKKRRVAGSQTHHSEVMAAGLTPDATTASGTARNADHWPCAHHIQEGCYEQRAWEQQADEQLVPSVVGWLQGLLHGVLPFCNTWVTALSASVNGDWPFLSTCDAACTDHHHNSDGRTRVARRLMQLGSQNSSIAGTTAGSTTAAAAGTAGEQSAASGEDLGKRPAPPSPANSVWIPGVFSYERDSNNGAFSVRVGPKWMPFVSVIRPAAQTPGNTSTSQNMSALTAEEHAQANGTGGNMTKTAAEHNTNTTTSMQQAAGSVAGGNMQAATQASSTAGGSAGDKQATDVLVGPDGLIFSMTTGQDGVTRYKVLGGLVDVSVPAKADSKVGRQQSEPAQAKPAPFTKPNN